MQMPASTATAAETGGRRSTATTTTHSSSDNVIAGNFLGTDATGNLDRGNGEGVTLVGAEDAGAPLYSNDFEGTIGAEWSTTATDVTPIGDRRFLGQFGNDTVTLTLDADSIEHWALGGAVLPPVSVRSANRCVRLS